jgi:hypothetical protein
MGRDFGFSAGERAMLSKLDSPAKIQDYVDGLKYNLEKKGETYYSPRNVMAHNEANCLEGAIFAAAALRFQGFPPLLIDLVASKDDSDHVLAVFRRRGRWGAIGKSKYTFFTYREPVYRTIRELALSYFDLYYNVFGKKTMRSFSKAPLNLARFDAKSWMTRERGIGFIATFLDRIPHEKIVARGMARNFRSVTPLDREAGELWIRRHGILGKMKKKGY